MTSFDFCRKSVKKIEKTHVCFITFETYRRFFTILVLSWLILASKKLPNIRRRPKMSLRGFHGRPRRVQDAFMTVQDAAQRPPDVFRTAQNATKAPSSKIRQAPKS